VPAQPPGLAVLLLHGNAGNISHRLDKLALLHGLGASVLLLDYRGYGASEGAPDEAGLYRDAEAAWSWLRARGQPPERIVLFGESLGGTVATDLAAHHRVGGSSSTARRAASSGRQAPLPLVPVGLFLAHATTRSRASAACTPRCSSCTARRRRSCPRDGRSAVRRRPRPEAPVRLAGGHNDAFWSRRRRTPARCATSSTRSAARRARPTDAALDASPGPAARSAMARIQIYSPVALGGAEARPLAPALDGLAGRVLGLRLDPPGAPERDRRRAGADRLGVVGVREVRRFEPGVRLGSPEAESAKIAAVARTVDAAIVGLGT